MCRKSLWISLRVCGHSWCRVTGDTFDNICKEIEQQLIADKNMRYGNIRNALQRALNVGQSLGIITLTNETIRMPFNFRSSPAAKGKAQKDDVQQVQQPAIGTGNPPAAQKSNERKAVVPGKRRSHEMENSFFSRRRDPDYMSSPAGRHKHARARARPKSRPRARKTARKPIRRRPYNRRR